MYCTRYLSNASITFEYPLQFILRLEVNDPQIKKKYSLSLHVMIEWGITMKNGLWAKKGKHFSWLVALGSTKKVQTSSRNTQERMKVQSKKAWTFKAYI